MTLGETDTTNRQRRQLADAAIHHATHGDWEAAVGGQSASCSSSDRTPMPTTASARRSPSSASTTSALEAYEQALARDATNRIAERNVERLRTLLAGGDGAGRRSPAGGPRRPPPRTSSRRWARPATPGS